MTHIPYTGAGPAVLALLGGQVDALATGPSTVVQQIKAGKLRALAHWGDKPLVSLPDRAEPGADSATRCSSPSGRRLFVPAGTPDEIVAKLRAAAPRRPSIQRWCRRSKKPAARSPTWTRPSSRRYWEPDAAP